MSVNEYKESIKHLIDATDNEVLLQHWKKQLEWDIKYQNEVTLSDEEWSLIEEGLTDYEKGEVISLEEFISKRNDKITLLHVLLPATLSQAKKLN